MKQIPLSMHYVALVDDADFEFINRFKWTADKRRNGRIVYAYRWDRTVKPHRKVYMHQAVLRTKLIEIDHINRDGLDNRRSNLRPCTRSQNQINKAKQAGCTSEYKGVYWNRHKKKWQAQIVLHGRNTSLGRFNREEDAAKHRRAAEQRRDEAL